MDGLEDTAPLGVWDWEDALSQSYQPSHQPVASMATYNATRMKNAMPHLNHSIMKYTTLAFLALLTALSPAQPIIVNEKLGIWTSKSPDKNYFIAMRRIPSSDGGIWDQDGDGFRLEVYLEENSLADYPCFKFVKECRIPSEYAWTPDSKFFVFSTESCGGHSPWNSKTYVFSVDAKKVVFIDDVIGPVVGSSFELKAPHTGIFWINSAGDTDNPTEKTLDLSQLFKKSPKHKTKQAGAAKPDKKYADITHQTH